MKKINKHSTATTKTTKKSVQEWSSYIDLFTYREAPANDESKKRIGLGLVKWAEENDEAYDLEEYFDTIAGVSIDAFQEWIKTDKILKEMYEKAKRFIGRRREKLGIKKNLNVNHTAIFMMPVYSKNWESQIEWRSRLKDKEENKSQIITVEIPSFTNLAIPEKKVNNDD